MCDPVTIAMTAGKAILQISAQNAEADKQEAQFQQNRISSIQARDLKVRQNNLRTIQEMEKLTAEENAAEIEALQVRDKQFMSALEGGLAASSNSVLALMRETDATQLRNETAINSETLNLLRQNQVDSEGFTAEAESRINSVARGEYADVAGTFISAGMEAAGGYYSANGDLGGLSSSANSALNSPSTALGFKYDTNPLSQQSLMLAKQEF